MLIVPVILRKSLISGKGIFAKRPIKKGAIIVRIGEKERYYTKERYSLFSTRYKKILDKYAYWDRSKHKIVYPLDNTKYLNHSCEPNVLSRGDLDIAARNIRKGEELTYNYSPIIEEKERFRCNCGSEHCRKIIVPSY